MLVYRVEHRDGGFGPYHIESARISDQDDELRRRAVANHEVDEERPRPFQDGLIRIMAEEFCCFASLETLGEWFDGDSLDLLYRAGYGVFSFEVDEQFVRHGKRQALFVRGEAVLVGELEPVSA